MGKKSDFPWVGFVYGCNFMNNDAAVSDNLSVDMMGEFTERFACHHLFFHPTRDIGCLIAVQNLRALKNERKLLRLSYFSDDLFELLENFRHHLVIFPLQVLLVIAHGAL